MDLRAISNIQRTSSGILASLHIQGRGGGGEGRERGGEGRGGGRGRGGEGRGGEGRGGEGRGGEGRGGEGRGGEGRGGEGRGGEGREGEGSSPSVLGCWRSLRHAMSHYCQQEASPHFIWPACEASQVPGWGMYVRNKYSVPSSPPLPPERTLLTAKVKWAGLIATAQ